MRTTALLVYSAIAFVVLRWRFFHLRGERLRRYQERKAQAMFRFATARCAFYTDRAQGTTWRSVPVVAKSELLAGFDDANSLGVTRSEVTAAAAAAEEGRGPSTLRGHTVGLSSGTSGERGVFLVAPREQAGWVGLVYGRMLPSWSLRRHHIALFLRANGDLYRALSTPWAQFTYFPLDLDDDALVQQLTTSGADIWVGPPSLLARLARLRDDGRLLPQPWLVVSGAEVLEPQVKARLESSFAMPVREIYQCTEGIIALSCAHGSLHVQEDVVLMEDEPLDDGRVVPIVTMLHRRALVYLRYRLDDVLVLSRGSCACGSSFRVIERIEGRRSDVLSLSSAHGTVRVYAEQVRRAVLGEGAGEYRVLQTGPAALQVHVDDDVGALDGVRARLDGLLRARGCGPVRIDVQRGLPVEDPRLKVVRVRRRYEEDGGAR